MIEEQSNLDTFFKDFHEEIFLRANELIAVKDKEDFLEYFIKFTDTILAVSLFLFIPRLRTLSQALSNFISEQGDKIDKSILLIVLNRMLEIIHGSSDSIELKGRDEDILSLLHFNKAGQEILIIPSDNKSFAIRAEEVIKIIEPGDKKLKGINSICLSQGAKFFFAVIVKGQGKTFAFLSNNRPYLTTGEIKVSKEGKYAYLTDQKKILFLDLNTLV